MIMDETFMNMLSARTKLLPDPGLLSRMKQAGQASADAFLSQHADALNDHDTVDLPALFS